MSDLIETTIDGLLAILERDERISMGQAPAKYTDQGVEESVESLPALATSQAGREAAIRQKQSEGYRLPVDEAMDVAGFTTTDGSYDLDELFESNEPTTGHNPLSDYIDQ